MKVYISLDAEGCSSLTSFNQVNRAHPEYSKCVESMSRDCKCVMQGIIDAGADHLVICDAHDDGANLPIDMSGLELKGTKVEYVRGHGTQMSMLAGLTSEFDAALFVGYHARRGSGGVMEHTYFQECVYDVHIADKPVGETTINAYLASEIGVPVVLVSGDETVCSEASELLPGIKLVPVKRALTCACALCYDDVSTHNRLSDAAFAAISLTSNGKFTPMADIPKEITVTYYNSGQAELASLIQGSSRVSPDKVSYSGDTFAQAYKSMLAGMYLANSFKY